MKSEKLRATVIKLQEYIERNDYRGYDPYDGLNSPLYKLPVLRSNKKIRFFSQQLIKRSPLNLRKIIFVPKSIDPVTLGLCLQAYTYLQDAIHEHKDEYALAIEKLLNQLYSSKSQTYRNTCWGYGFPWESRYFSLPPYDPTLVATAIIVNALYENYKTNDSERIMNIIIDAGKFVLEDINRSYAENGSFCFSYSPYDNEKIYNASMKGVRILSFIYELTREDMYKETAAKAADFVIKKQNQDGSWFYSDSRHGGWIDNYHTGYILDCLGDFIKLCNPATNDYTESFKKGSLFYLNNFFQNGTIPKIYDKKIYPVDSTAAAQSIFTLIRMDEMETATNVAEWMIDNMQNDDGSFSYRKYKNHTVKTSFMRWSNAWMFAGLSLLLKKTEKN